ncbi:uncharacterized protein TNCV_2843321 [Trichonephila clavipes]|nr:uncharacterized protein TNCV_2843321 [Trichonephila clavipes]
MSRGFTDTIPKQSSSRHNGKPPVLLGQRKHGRCDQSSVMLIVFFDADGIVHHKYGPQGQTVNKEFYLDVMRRIREAVRRKRPVLWASSRWMLHHDGAPAQTANLVQPFLTKHGTIQVAHPPYSPDMSPPDFSFSPRSRTP